jgi:transposase
MSRVSSDECAISSPRLDRHGAKPFIAFKANHTGRGSRLWEKMHAHFTLRRDDFLAHYHQRSNVESTFSMIKAKFRDHVRSKTPVAMVNEVLCKLICHNICVVAHEMQELGISAELGSVYLT